MGQAEWPDDQVELAVAMRRKGMSASQIARRLVTRTRNAVIGKLNRLGLVIETSPERNRLNAKIGGRVSGEARRKKNGFQPARGNIPVEPQRPFEMPAARATGAGALRELRITECRWPIGNPRDQDFRFCGCACVEGRSYCAHHYAASIKVKEQL